MGKSKSIAQFWHGWRTDAREVQRSNMWWLQCNSAEHMAVPRGQNSKKDGEYFKPPSHFPECRVEALECLAELDQIRELCEHPHPPHDSCPTVANSTLHVPHQLFCAAERLRAKLTGTGLRPHSPQQCRRGVDDTRYKHG